ncbi:MAG: type I-U CRISPR-associated protein Csb2 [Bifidobacterium sp.]
MLLQRTFCWGRIREADSGGRPEPYPSPDRLYKACVAAAYNTRLILKGKRMIVILTDEQIKNALAWLEDNPPHSILLPRVIPPTSDAISYRDKGYLEKGKVKKSPDKASKAMSYCQNAVESLLLTWQWDENPNQEVINTLNLLCSEVPYLGEACSVVELKVIAGGVYRGSARQDMDAGERSDAVRNF